MSRMNGNLITKTIERHRKWLAGEYPHAANFCHKGLWRANFSGIDLSYADFSGANLKRVNFSGADLSYADFSGANLKAADFRKANLTETCFIKANLERAKFNGSKLNRTDFSKANLTKAHIEKGCEDACDFTEANLSGTELGQEDNHMVFYLDKTDGEVHLMVKKNGHRHLLLTITKRGTLRRACLVPAHLGFVLDNEGRIKLLN